MRPSIPHRPSWHGRSKNSASGPNPHVFFILSPLRKCVGGNIEFSTSINRRIFSRASQESDRIWRFGLAIGQTANCAELSLLGYWTQSDENGVDMIPKLNATAAAVSGRRSLKRFNILRRAPACSAIWPSCSARW